MHIHHVALYTRDLERMKAFYQRYFGCQANDGYHNPATGLKTYFLIFPDGGRLEIMTRPDVTDGGPSPLRAGYIHISVGVESREMVCALTDTLRAEGYAVIGEPRVTGDGYFESVVCDPDGNAVELVADEASAQSMDACT